MSDQYEDLNPKQPENIALSFSGGGFRAATFGLGCLSYMEQINFGTAKMTDLVRFVSSASGGTFTALAWTCSQKKDERFDTFYKRFYEQVLSGDRLLDRAIQILKNKSEWEQRPQKSRNLINAFAIAYDELVFNGETFDIYYRALEKGAQAICVNATEFDNGEQFRFQNEAVAGNKFLHFKGDGESQQTLRALKLGDILACSSCFTAGFEPVVYPRDFICKSITEEQLKKAIKSDNRYSPVKDDIEDREICFDLMDGGIDDNQGIHSFMLAEDRLQTNNEFGYDLYMACDVSSNYTEAYQFPAQKPANTLSIFSLMGWAAILGILVLVCVLAIMKGTLLTAAYISLGLTGGLFLIIAILTLMQWVSLNKSAKSGSTFSLVGKKYLSVFLKLPLYVLKPMLSSRATSTGYLATTVFLKKIRRVTYELLFTKISEQKHPDKVILKHWSRFSLMNAIYQLSIKNKTQRDEDLKKETWYQQQPVLNHDGVTKPLSEWMDPSPVLQWVAATATEMATTLWFDKNQLNLRMPESLVATGQFTTCYNLLRYVYRFPQSDAYWKPVQNKLFNDWCLFMNDPFWLFKENQKK